MDTNSVFGEILERGQSAVVKNVKGAVSSFAKSAVGQISGSQSDQGTSEQAAAQKKMSDDEAKKFLQGLYGSPDKSQDQKENPEEKAKLEALRKQLHSDYYQNLINPKKTQEEPVVEKLEREKEEDRWKLEQKKAEKPPPLPATVKQGTGENVVGVSG